MASPCNHFESASLLLSDYAFAKYFQLFLQAKAESIWLIAYNKKSLSNRLLYLKGFFSEQVVPLVIPQLHYYFVYTSYGKPVSY